MSAPSATGRTVDERLREASAASEAMRCTTPRVDMSSEAIDRRLREVAELRATCLELARLGSTAARP